MENTARLFNCARCPCQVMICSRCDRGNIYCHPRCAQQARRESLRAAGQRYQRSRRGRFTHAERQRRYRAHRKKVTHQGSPSPAAGDSLRSDSEGAVVPTNPATVERGAEGIRCAFCAARCSGYVRLDFLRRRPSAGSQTIPDTHPPP